MRQACSQFISDLPEILMSTLSAYFDLCTVGSSGGSIGANTSPGTGLRGEATAPAGAGRDSDKPESGLPAATTLGSILTKEKFHLIINEKVVVAVAQCLKLLANEYKRGLKRKHWVKYKVVSLSIFYMP